MSPLSSGVGVGYGPRKEAPPGTWQDLGRGQGESGLLFQALENHLGFSLN